VVALILLACCGGDRSSPPGAKSAVIGDHLMAYLGIAKAYHAKARIYAIEGKLALATGSMRELLALEYPDAPEAEDVRNDARARLATWLVGQTRFDDAMAVVSEGISESKRESFFVANLYTIKGELHEARAEALVASDPVQVAAERRAALDAYDRSNQINSVRLRGLSQPAVAEGWGSAAVVLLLVVVALAGAGVALGLRSAYRRS